MASPNVSTSVAKKLLIRVLLFSSLITLVLSTLQLGFEFNNDLNEIDEIRFQVKRSYTKSVQNAVWGLHLSQAQSLMDGITSMPTILLSKIEFRGEKLAESRLEGLADKAEDAGVVTRWQIYSPNQINQDSIGELIIVQTRQFAFENLKKRILIVLFSNFFKTFLVAAFILYLVNILISRHLIKISQYVTDNNFIQNSEPLTLNREENRQTFDEIDILAHSVNETRQQLITSWQDLSSSESRYRSLIEGSIQGVILLAKHWKLLFINEKARVILEDNADDAILSGESIKARFSDDFVREINQYFKEGDISALQDEHRETELAINNRLKYVQILLKEVCWGGEAVLQFILYDISEKKLLERKQREYELQLIQMNKMSSLGTMISGVAHEINNPNYMIQQNTRILEGFWDSLRPLIEQYFPAKEEIKLSHIDLEEVKTIIPEILEDQYLGSKRIEKVIDDLKRFSKQEESKTPKMANLNDIVKEAIKILGSKVKECTHKLTLDLKNDLPEVLCFEQRLSQAIINLITNALDSLRSMNESITIRTSSDTDNVYLHIEDEGSGISKKNQHKIYDLFFTTKMDQGRAGLGLSIVYSVVQQHRGDVKVHSVEGTGSKFVISIPVDSRPYALPKLDT